MFSQSEKEQMLFLTYFRKAKVQFNQKPENVIGNTEEKRWIVEGTNYKFYKEEARELK